MNSVAAKKPSKIETSGQLRSFLADMLVGIKNGHVEVATASQITKMAAQINESLYAEIKAARIHADLNKSVADFGSLKLGITEE